MEGVENIEQTVSENRKDNTLKLDNLNEKNIFRHCGVIQMMAHYLYVR